MASVDPYHNEASTHGTGGSVEPREVHVDATSNISHIPLTPLRREREEDCFDTPPTRGQLAPRNVCRRSEMLPENRPPYPE